ncbi:enoyl-CoA hydratase/isomerase family protein [Leptospira bouyouniensis]|uniref:enoyl-CoA hydratase/isomerase family protein n=1 Tax=Leptospira bouyouniensis TaxID=2484911 RepID=UPI0010912DA3|nr:enoyl-CoA hydratase/isomerase family protein [Leptospira bouyouniensis]TGM87601.1 enoyl-CoA hydratase/isomerase family protein [Leptospira bouyouniensis]
MNYKREVIDLPNGKGEIIRFQMNEQNSLTGQNMRDLGEILNEIKEDPTKKGVILGTDNPKFFCNGLDAENLLATPKNKLIEEVGGIVILFGELVKFDKPLITEVTGYAMGGGAVITVASDYKYMLDGKCRIGFTEVNVGLPLPGSFIDRIKMCVEPRYWAEVCLEGTIYKAPEAKKIGLIDEIASTPEEVRKLSVKKLEALSKIPSSALRSTKNTLNAALIRNLEQYKIDTTKSFEQPGVVDNLLEAMTALKEKRRPVFQ